MIPFFDKTQKVLSQDLENHAHVHPVRTLVVEGIEQADDVLAAGMIYVGLDDLVEQLDLVQGCLGVVCSGSHNLEGNMLARRVVSREPDGGEVAPAQFANHRVFAVVVLLANLDGVVAALAVILGIFFFGRVFVGLIARGGGGRW